jgi:hypothetical protein
VTARRKKFVDLGDQALKNIARPVRVYSVKFATSWNPGDVR